MRVCYCIPNDAFKNSEKGLNASFPHYSFNVFTQLDIITLQSGIGNDIIQTFDMMVSTLRSHETDAHMERIGLLIFPEQKTRVVPTASVVFVNLPNSAA